MSLSIRLRDAAIERSHLYGEVIRSCVLGPDGVIDLRSLENSSTERPSTRPAAALAEIAGGFDHDIDISHLYCHDSPSRFELRRHRRAR